MRMITMFFIIACIITACSNDDNPNVEMTNGVPQFGITECFIQYKCSVKTPPPHTIRSG